VKNERYASGAHDSACKRVASPGAHRGTPIAQGIDFVSGIQLETTTIPNLRSRLYQFSSRQRTGEDFIALYLQTAIALFDCVCRARRIAHFHRVLVQLHVRMIYIYIYIYIYRDGMWSS